jgi:hypothetical protein
MGHNTDLYTAEIATESAADHGNRDLKCWWSGYSATLYLLIVCSDDLNIG